MGKKRRTRRARRAQPKREPRKPSASRPKKASKKASSQGGRTHSSTPKSEASQDEAPKDWPEIGRAYALMLLSGVFVFLGFAGFDVWPLAFVAMVPAMFVVDGRTGAKPSGTGSESPRPTGWKLYRRTLLFGYIACYGGFYWVVDTIVDFGGFPYPLALAFASIYFFYEAHQFVLVMWLWRRCRDRGWNPTLSLVAAFAASEVAFPMLFDHYHGNSFHMLPQLVQVVDLGGPILLTVLAMLGSGAVYELMSARLRGESLPWKSPAVFAAAVVFSVGYSAYRIDDVETRMAAAEHINVGVVQTNMGIYEKRDDPGEGLRRHLAQSRLLEEEGEIDLLVWPESAATFVMPRSEGTTVPPYFENALRFYGIDSPGFPTTPILFGGLSAEQAEGGERVLYNTAFMTDAEGRVVAHYDKTYLLGFGEYLPFGDTFPILYEWSPNTGHFTPGDHVRALPLGDFRVSALVCYEDILPSFVRQAVAENDPHLLVNITNDAWFGETNEPYVHLDLAKLRAVEHHRFLVRATNTGISAVIDPLGRVVAEGPLFDVWQGSSEVAMLDGSTLYQTVGNWAGWLGLAGVVFLGFLGRSKELEHPRGPEKSPPAEKKQPTRRRARRRDEEE